MSNSMLLYGKREELLRVYIIKISVSIVIHDIVQMSSEIL